MKKLLLFWIALLAFSMSYGQSITNYAFSYSFTGSLEDMSSGTTSLLTGNNDDNGSAVTNIGFTFIYMGVPYTQFSVNSNGQLRLGSTAIGGTNVSSFSAGVPILAPMAGDNEVNNGIVYKVIGTAPNRILVVQWTEFYASFTNITGSGNMQLLLHEGTGVIDFIYGNIYNSSTSATTRSIFISASNTATTAGYVTVGTTPTFTPAAAPVTNSFAASVPIANLASTAQGSRTVYTWTPPTVLPTAPTNLTFSGVTSSAMTLNWTDSPDEGAYAISRSLDGITYTFVSSLAANTITYPATGLSSNTTYYWKVSAVSEAQIADLTGSQITSPAVTYYWVGTTGGTFSTTTNWNTAADGSGAARTTSDVSDILIVDGDGTTPGGSTTINVDVASFSIGQFLVTSNTNLTLQSSITTTRTITLIGGSGNDLVIENGSTLNLNNATMAVAFAFSGAGLTGDISGTYNASGSTSNVINTTGGTGTLVTVTATGVVNNSIVGSSGCLTGSVATLSFANGSNYTHSAYTSSNGYIPLATWGATSNIFITGGVGSTAITNAPGQTFGNFTYNSATSTSTCSAFTSSTATVIQGNLTILASNTGKFRIVTTGTLTINGNLVVSGGLAETSNNTGTINVLGNVNITGGTFDVAFASSPTLKVAGNFVQTGGTIIQTSATGMLEFNGTSAQNLTVLAGAHGTNVINVRINNPAGVILTNDMLIRNLTVSNGNLAGTGVLSYNGTSGLLTYNGTTGTQLATATEFPAVNGPSSLTINNTSAIPNNIVGIPFSRRLAGTSGVLTLTSGILANPTYVLSISNTAVAGIAGGSATSYVAGGLERDLPASLATGTTYNFPVGKSRLNKFALVNPTTNAGGTVTVLAEVMDGNCGGTAGALLQSLKTNRYWTASITNGGANFTNSLIQLNDSTYGADAIAGSTTINGTYDIVGGTAITATATSLTTTAPESTTLPGFFVMANKAAPLVSNVVITPSGNQCTNVQRTVTATVTAGGGAVTGVAINYSINGTAQTPIAMTNVSGNDWSGDIPVVTPSNANVTWSVVATDVNLLTGTFVGTAYKDEPAAGITATATISETTVCSGSPVVLTMNISSSLTAATYANPPAVTNPTVDEDLGNVTITEGATTILNNTSTRNVLDGTIGIPTGTAGSFSNYTAYGPFGLTAGTLYNFSVSTLQSTTAYNNAIGIYIDYNRDGDFGDAGEAVYVSSTTTSGAHTETGSFTVPTTANNGLTRMRVLVNEGNVTGPTMSVSYGEYEEYMLNISSANVGGGGTVVPDSYAWSDGAVTVGTTNPSTVNPTSNKTYTGTAIISGCPVVSNSVSVTVNPLPSTPTANNSTQCGVAVPACSVNSTSGAPSPTFNWYDVPTGGTPLAGITGATYTGAAISTTTYFYVAEYDGTCESERVMVTATVGAAPALTITTDQSACNNAAASLTVTSLLSDFDSYVWTPSTDLYTDAAGTIPYVDGTSVSTVYFKTATAGVYTITCSSNNSGNGCSNVATSNVTVLPSAITATASETEFCHSGSSSISVTPATGYGVATFQWMSSTDNVTFSDIVGANAISYTTPVITDTMYYKMLVELGATTCTESNVAIININNPQVVSTTPATRCGDGTVTLSASGQPGTTMNWYDAATGGNFLASGASFVTPVLTDTTDFYVAAAYPGTEFGGRLAPAGTSTTTASSYGLVFTAVKPFTLYSVDVYATTAGNVIVQLQNSAGTILITDTFPVVAGGATTAQALPLNYSIPAGTDLRLIAKSSPSMVRESALGGFPYSLGANGQITSGYITGTSPTYYFFYNWVMSGECESARTAVSANIKTAPVITVAANDSTICQNESVTLTATSANDPDYAYSWTPVVATGATLNDSPMTTTTYNVVATDSTGGINDGCIAYGSVTVTVNPIPTDVVITASDASLCAGDALQLSATATSNADVSLNYAEGFDTWPPVDWTFINGGSGNNWVAGTTTYAGAGSMKYGYNSANPANAWAITPGLDLTAGVNYTLTFWYKVASSTFPEDLRITVGNDATIVGQTTVLWDNNGDTALTNTTFAQATIVYNPTVSGTYFFGFNCYSDANMFNLFVDEVSITGSASNPVTYEWTSVPAGFTSSDQAPASFTPATTAQYIVTVENTYGCTASADTNVVVNPLPIVYLGSDQDICDTTTITLDAGNPGSTYTWSTGGTSQTEDVLGSDLGAGANVVSVTVTTAAGCIGFDDVTINVTICDGIEDPSVQISYYPNPATDQLNLDLSQLPSGDYRFELLDMQGQKVIDRIIINDGSVMTLSLTDVAPGSYIISVTGNNNSFRNYLSIQK